MRDPHLRVALALTLIAPRSTASMLAGPLPATLTRLEHVAGQSNSLSLVATATVIAHLVNALAWRATHPSPLCAALPGGTQTCLIAAITATECLQARCATVTRCAPVRIAEATVLGFVRVDASDRVETHHGARRGRGRHPLLRAVRARALAARARGAGRRVMSLR